MVSRSAQRRPLAWTYSCICTLLLSLASAVAFELPERVVVDAEAGWACRVPGELNVVDCFRPIFGGSNSPVGWKIDSETPGLPAWLRQQTDVKSPLRLPIHARLMHVDLKDAAKVPPEVLLLQIIPDDMLGVPAPGEWQWQKVDLLEHYKKVAKGLEKTLRGNVSCYDGIAHNGTIQARLIATSSQAVLLLTAALPPTISQEILASLEPLDRKGDTWTARQAARNIIRQADENGEPQWTRLNGLPTSAPKRLQDAYHFETEHFLLVAQVGPKQLLYLAQTLEALDNAYRTVFNAKDEKAICKATVIIPIDFATYAQLSAQFGMNVGGPGTGAIMNGYFNPSRILMVTYNDKLPNSNTTVEDILAHECTHQFVHLLCNGSSHVPLWLNEGLAVYFENIRVQGSGWKWEPPADRLARLLPVYKNTQRTLRPLAQWLDPNNRNITVDEYGEAYAMVHFWLFASPDGRKLFTAYWKALQEGQDGNEAFNELVLQKLAPNNGGSAQAVLDLWQEKLHKYAVTGKLSRRGY